MSIDLLSLIFICLLPPTASSTVTPGQNYNFTNVMRGETGKKFTNNQLRIKETSSLNPLSEVTEEKTTQPRSKSSPQTTGTPPFKEFILNIQTTATPTSFISTQLNNSTGGMKSVTAVQFKATTSATTVVRSGTTNPTTTRRASSELNSSQKQDMGKTLTSKSSSDKMTHPSKSTTQSTNVISSTTSNKSAENKSKSTIPFTGGDNMHFTGLYKTSLATTNTPSTQITEKRGEPADPFEKGPNHSNAVAGLIGGALVLMMVGFLVICLKKKMLQRQQITTKDWAGPSPFLEGGADNGQITFRSSKRISLNSFLPQRLSKRLSLLPEIDEELQNMAPGTTFGSKHQDSAFGQEMDGNHVQGTSGTAVGDPKIKSTGDAPELVENSVSVS